MDYSEIRLGKLAVALKDLYMAGSKIRRFAVTGRSYQITTVNRLEQYLIIIDEEGDEHELSFDYAIKHFAFMNDPSSTIDTEYIKLDEPFKSREQQQSYDYINPSHYQKGGKEVIEMMEDIWGPEKLIAHCEMCAFKYRMRVGEKPNQTVERDLDKARWYENKAKELREKLSRKK